MQQELASAGFAQRQFNTGEVTLNYVEGAANGTPLVLIPAQMGTWESYAKVLLPLLRHFHVYALDVRGHGQSSWTTGDYSWASIGRDMTAFMQQVVQRPTILAGNSSGGIIALWVGANLPELTAAVVLEDAPVFSAEMPRFREQDRFVYNGLAHLVDAIGDPNNRDLADYFRGQEVPTKSGRVRRVPNWFVSILSSIIRRYEKAHPGQPVEISYLPGPLRLLLKSISTFDPDFARAFVDGRFYEGLDHAEALKRLQCPLLVMHADWFRHPKYGLVGAMDDADAAHIKALVPQSEYVKIPANHVIHAFKPAAYIEALEAFAARNGLLSIGS
jgi:pimeloyl-ACP methyl ester carboxylesterase